MIAIFPEPLAACLEAAWLSKLERLAFDGTPILRMCDVRNGVGILLYIHH